MNDLLDYQKKETEVALIVDSIERSVKNGTSSQKDLMQYVRNKYILLKAFNICKQNGKAPGVDGRKFSEFKWLGNASESSLLYNKVLKFINEIIRELNNGTYKPMPLRRSYIRKPDGSKRALGIPTIKDRVVQQACRIVLEPIFEQSFHNCSYAYRPDRNVLKAMHQLENIILRGKTHIFDTDIKKCFDTIPHQLILDNLCSKVGDKKIIGLIEDWLKAPIDEDGILTYPKCGTPQGGVISPLLANIALHRSDDIFYLKGGLVEKYKAYEPEMIRYADDIIVAARYIPQGLRNEISESFENMGLQLSKEKTKIIDLQNHEEALNFLGFQIRLTNLSPYVLWIMPRNHVIEKAYQAIDAIINDNSEKEYIIQTLNAYINFWNNYYGEVCTEIRVVRKLNNHLYEHLKKINTKRKNVCSLGEFRLQVRDISSDKSKYTIGRKELYGFGI